MKDSNLNFMMNEEKLDKELLMIKRQTLRRFKLLILLTTLAFEIFLIFYPYTIFKVSVAIILVLQFLNIVSIEVVIKKICNSKF
jgi:hypothetical protein